MIVNLLFKKSDTFSSGSTTSFAVFIQLLRVSPFSPNLDKSYVSTKLCKEPIPPFAKVLTAFGDILYWSINILAIFSSLAMAAFLCMSLGKAILST